MCTTHPCTTLFVLSEDRVRDSASSYSNVSGDLIAVTFPPVCLTRDSKIRLSVLSPSPPATPFRTPEREENSFLD